MPKFTIQEKRAIRRIRGGSGGGSSGADGADGNTVLNGSGAPSGGLGANGDFYIDTDVYDIYGPKTAGTWGSGTSLVGSGGGGSLPVGGTIGQILTKQSSTDGDADWEDLIFDGGTA